MKRVLFFASSLLFAAVSCTSDSSREVESKGEEMIEEAPTLTFELNQDTLTKKWDIVFQWNGQADTIHTDVSANYTFLDTVDLDSTGHPECLVTRDSVFVRTGINHKGNWSYFEEYQIVDIWSFDQKERLGSIIQSMESESRDDWDWILNGRPSEQKSAGVRIRSYAYEIEFEPGAIIIKNLKTDGYVRKKPKLVEGKYVLNDGSLELIEEE